MLDVLGATGAFLLAFCGIPEVISSVRKGYCGSSLGLLLTWLTGEVLTFAYVLITNPDIYLLCNYAVNAILIVVLLYYKRKDVHE